MITEKSHDTENLYTSLFDAITAAFEEAISAKGVWVAHYIDPIDDEDYWHVSITNHRDGINKLNMIETAGFIKLFEEIGHTERSPSLIYLASRIEEIIFDRWSKEDSIVINTVKYRDHYDAYGISRSDFY
jgi:hypothetical protein